MSEAIEKIVWNLLIQLGLAGGSTGWGVSYVKMPTGTGNNKFITTKKGSSELEEAVIVDKATKAVMQGSKFGVQVRVRDTNYDLAEQKTRIIKEALLNIVEETTVFNGKTFLIHNFKLTSDVTYIGEEEVGPRHHFTCNWTVSLTEQ